MMQRSTRSIVLAAGGAIMAVGLSVAPVSLDPAHVMAFQQAFAENNTAYNLSLRERAYSLPSPGDRAAVFAYRAMPKPAIAPSVLGTLLADDDASTSNASGQPGIDEKAPIK